MDKILNHRIWTTHALLLARILMGTLFIITGLQRFGAIDGAAQYIASVGLPASVVLAWISAIVEVGLGVAIILGVYFKEVVLSLAVYVLIVSFIFHSPSQWAENPMQQMLFLKNMTIIAGLLFMAAHGAGNTWKLNLGRN